MCFLGINNNNNYNMQLLFNFYQFEQTELTIKHFAAFVPQQEINNLAEKNATI